MLAAPCDLQLHLATGCLQIHVMSITMISVILCDVISVIFWSLCEIFEELNHIMITFSWASIFQGFRKHNLESFAANHLKDLWWIEPHHHHLGAHTLPLFHGQEHISRFRKHNLESLLQTIWTFEWKELSIITIELLVYNWELVCDTNFVSFSILTHLAPFFPTMAAIKRVSSFLSNVYLSSKD